MAEASFQYVLAYNALDAILNERHVEIDDESYVSLCLRAFVLESWHYRPPRPKSTLTLAHSGGPSTSSPTSTAVTAPTSTAAAATSLPTLARGCRSGEARSTTAS